MDHANYHNATNLARVKKIAKVEQPRKAVEHQ